jgi:hypothetical protein
MGFLKTLLIIILVYYLLRILGRWLAPKVFNYAVKKTEERFRNAFDQANMNSRTGDNEAFSKDRNSKEGRVGSSSEPVGEYIDFEEIE